MIMLCLLSLSACSTTEIYRTKIVRPPIKYNLPCVVPKAEEGMTYKIYIADLIDTIDKCSARNAAEEVWFDELQTKVSEG